MTATLVTRLLLPGDVLLTPVMELPARVREQLAGDSDDVAVTRPRGRHPSCVVEARSAVLLERFRQPATVAEAVADHARSDGSDPVALLEDAYPMLRRLLDAGFLVAADSALAGQIRPTIEPGARLGSATVVRCIQVLEDVELHQVRLADGRLAAAKLLRTGAPAAAARQLTREEAILQRLDGRVNPRPLAEPPAAPGECLLMEWRAGVPVEIAAAEARAARLRDGGEAVLKLAQTVVAAFAHLHAQGVIHGDVHPRNVLIAVDGAASVVDYGLALDARAPSSRADRGGVPFFFEPELAASWDGRAAPATRAGEQYGLGALLYLLVTGAHYLEFSPERDVMLAQIQRDPPRPFEATGLAPWPGLERVLRRALAKAPGDRFPNLDALAAALAVAHGPATFSRRNTSEHSAAAAVAHRFVTDVSPGSQLYANPDELTAPRCSVNYGASGIALALCRIAMAREDPALLALADHWATLALRDSDRQDAFVSEALDLTPAVTGTVSPYHRESGLHCVRAQIAAAMGNETLQLRATEAFLAAARAPAGADLTLGRSGVLVACAILRDASTGAAAASLEALGQEVLDEVWTELDALPPIGTTGDDRYAGIAHGWAGYAYAALLWCAAAGAAVPSGVERRLEELAGLAVPVGRGLAWPIRPGRSSAVSDTMAGWCHGSAGYVHLWLTAADTLSDDNLRELAVRAGWHAWEAPDRVGSLCCGLCGRGYAMLALQRATGGAEWLRRAEQLADAAVYGIDPYDLPPLSLWKGFTGIAVLAEDLNDPSAAALPLFEREPAFT